MLWVVFFLTLSGFCFAQDAAVLTRGAAVSREIESGQVHRIRLPMQAGDVAIGVVHWAGRAAGVEVYDAKGQLVRPFRATGEITNFVVIADSAGDHEIRLSVPKGISSTRYDIRLKEFKRHERVSSEPVEEFVSARVRKLRDEVSRGKPNAEGEFWAEVRERGAPLIEDIAGDPRHKLVTFVWKASGPTYAVVVEWHPFARARPEDYMMVAVTGTSVWAKTVKIRSDARFLYQLSPNPVTLRGDFGTPEAALRTATSIADPLNPKRRPAKGSPYDAGSILEMPDAPPQLWSSERSDVTKGRLQKDKFRSEILGNERDVEVYTPPGYSPNGQPYPVLVVFDQSAYTRGGLVPTPTILDNLIAEGRIAPMMAVLVNNVSQAARSEELACNRRFAQFLATELMPWVWKSFHASRKPSEVYAAGSSYGGLTATCTAMFHPEVVGNVISQSGSYWWDEEVAQKRKEDPSYWPENPNWVARQFIARQRLPIRFWLDAGLYERDLSGRGNSILIPNRHVRDVLLAKGYEVHYHEFAGGHDYLSWRGTLAQGLLALARREGPK